MTAPGVGPIVALTYASAIDDPGRFSSSKQVSAHFGLTPRRYQSGETDYSGRISKSGDAAVRAALFEGRPHHTDQTAQGVYGAQKLGDADCPAGRDEEGEGRAGAQARGDPASHACRRHCVHRRS